MHSFAIVTLGIALVSATSASTVAASSRSKNHVWDLSKFTSLVAFGDSYTDENRLGYFLSNLGSAPPVGWVEPEVRSHHSLFLSHPNI